MRSSCLVILLLAALLAGCGGAGARTYSRTQAYRIVAGCMKRAGATSVRQLGRRGGEATFGAGGSLQWGYVMSAGRVADVFASGDPTASVRAGLDACLKPEGWSVS